MWVVVAVVVGCGRCGLWPVVVGCGRCGLLLQLLMKMGEEIIYYFNV